MDRTDRPSDQPAGPGAARPWSRDNLRARLDRLPPNHPSSPRYNPSTSREPPRPRDAPRQADQQPERLRPWYSPHVAREQEIQRQRHEHRPGADPKRWREDWYQQRHADVPAPFREEIAERVPTRAPGSPQGTTGRLDRHDGGDGLPLDSGRKTGLVEALEHRDGRLPPGYTSQNTSHVEAHAAAWLHLNPHIRDATLYINRRPCPGPKGCRSRLPEMLPPGTTLTVYGPHEFWQVYHGGRNEEGGS